MHKYRTISDMSTGLSRGESFTGYVAGGGRKIRCEDEVYTRSRSHDEVKIEGFGRVQTQ